MCQEEIGEDARRRIADREQCFISMSMKAEFIKHEHEMG